MRWLPILVAAVAGCQAGQRFQEPPPITLDDLLPAPQVDGWSVGALIALAFEATGGDSFTAESTEPSVAEVGGAFQGDDGEWYALLEAVSPGEAEVVLRDEDGQEVERLTVLVREPDHVELHPAATVIAGGSQPETTLKVLVDGVAAFEIRWFSEDDERLHPPDWSVSGAHGVWVQTWSTHGRNWLRITPELDGEQTVTLRHGDTTFETWTLDARPLDAVARIDLVDVETATDVRAIHGVSLDAEGDPIRGAELEWSVRGRHVDAMGDLYLYTPDPDVDVRIEAALGDMTGEARLHGPGGPWSSADIGCSSLGGAGLGLAWLLPALVAVRRRHRVS